MLSVRFASTLLVVANAMGPAGGSRSAKARTGIGKRTRTKPKEQTSEQQPGPQDPNQNQPEKLRHVYVQLTTGFMPVFAAGVTTWHSKYVAETLVPF